jgi:mRNA-degrading endonuclease RelE of RelBE toxin-antitoxin system
MPYEIILAPEAAEDLGDLKANLRAEVREGMETHLRHEPGKTSRGRIKRLRKLSQPQYRLRIGDVRVFYDISEKNVEVLAVVLKSEAAPWLAKHGKSESK